MVRRTRFILAFIQFVDVSAAVLALVALPVTAARFGLTPLGAAATFATLAVSAAASAPLLVRASERWGRKPVLVATGLLTAEALFVAAWAGDVYMLMLSRIAAGVGIGAIAVVVAAGRDLVSSHGADPESFPYAVRGYGLGVLGGLVLGFGLSAFGHGVPAYAAAVAAVVALVEVVALFEETRRPEQAQTPTAL